MELIVDLLELLSCELTLLEEIHAQEMIIKWTLIIDFYHGVNEVTHSLRQVFEIDHYSNQKVVDTRVYCLSFQTFFILVQGNFYEFCELDKDVLKDLIKAFKVFLMHFDINCHWLDIKIIVVGFLSFVIILHFS